MIQITIYWNKVKKNIHSPFGSEVLPEYEIKSQWTQNGFINEIKQRVKNSPRCTVYKNRVVEDLGTYYGIHSYSEIKEVAG